MRQSHGFSAVLSAKVNMTPLSSSSATFRSKADCGQKPRDGRPLLRRRTKPGLAMGTPPRRATPCLNGVLLLSHRTSLHRRVSRRAGAPPQRHEATCGWSMTIRPRVRPAGDGRSREKMVYPPGEQNFIYHCAILSLQTKKSDRSRSYRLLLSSQLIWRCGQSDPELCWSSRFRCRTRKPVSRSCRSVRYPL